MEQMLCSNKNKGFLAAERSQKRPQCGSIRVKKVTLAGSFHLPQMTAENNGGNQNLKTHVINGFKLTVQQMKGSTLKQLRTFENNLLILTLESDQKHGQKNSVDPRP